MFPTTKFALRMHLYLTSADELSGARLVLQKSLVITGNSNNGPGLTSPARKVLERAVPWSAGGSALNSLRCFDSEATASGDDCAEESVRRRLL
jgi:hypothetical protein